MRNYSKGAKLRAKKELPKLEGVPRKQPNGRKRRQRGQVAESDPQRTVLDARARHMGIKKTDARELKVAALSEPAGQAIYAALSGDEARKAWDAYAGFTASEARYHARYTGLRLHAKTAKIEMAPERFEAREDDYVDLRSEDQKDRRAANDWAKWRGLIMHLSAADQTAIFDVAYGRVSPMDGGKITKQGKRFVDAAGRFAAVVEK